MTAVAIIDYGLCNLDSIVRAVEECGGAPIVACDPGPVATADQLILPGVGAFPMAIKNLRARGLADAILERVEDGVTPLLGICLGMQLLASRSSEFSGAEGLDLIPGDVKALSPATPDERVPHMGWNEVDRRNDCPLLDGVPPEKDFYFVHSYHLACEVDSDIAATTTYCGGFVSMVQRENILGTQFHPEKSQRAGFALLRNFIAL
jgi:imidazole glycerol-phosphate synthase subunit HisH